MAIDNDDDDFLHAADEPTAMWDESALKELGLEPGLAASQSAPATTGTGRHRAIGVELTQGPADPPKKKSEALAWVITLVLAVGLAVGMYYLVRSFR